jgi:hypothetical protein
MLFNFTLAPLRTIAPWRSADGPFLHWFGLSDGARNRERIDALDVANGLDRVAADVSREPAR